MTEERGMSDAEEFPSLSGAPSLPILLDVVSCHCVVIGGGKAGRLKAAALLAAGAIVTVIDPKSAQIDGVKQAVRKWQPGDSADSVITVIATDDPSINEAAAVDAAFHHSLVLRADRAEVGQIRFPAVHRRDDVTVTVDTTGASPTLAAYLRDKIAEQTKHWGTLADWARIHRPVTREEIAEHEARLHTGRLD